ncbi:MAG: anaerobic glycerol-3-phosphate dehydrogenase subunit C [Desulfotignum sp.]|nr:anaerobic glycerol-3-phosphate dehydrogenase subunit C [Desulfotignum sp.]
MVETFNVYIHRYDAQKDPASYIQTYELNYHASQTVLEVLTEIRNSCDDSLSFRSSCEAAKCGSCAVELNGKPVLACKSIVDGHDIHIKPLSGFPVVKDLVVDRERYEKGYVQMLSCEKSADTFQKPDVALFESEIDYANLSCCIGCLICNSACPVGAQMADRFPGPAVITEVLSSGVRMDQEGESRAPVEDSIDYCSLCLNCHVACPSGVALNRINARAKNAYTRGKGRSLRDWMLGRAELMGKMGSFFPSASNAMLTNKTVRKGMDAALGISREARMVPYARSLKKWLQNRPEPAPIPEAVKRRVVYFTGCYTRYNDTDPGRDAVAIMEHLGFEVRVPEQNCCGVPLISSGDMDAAGKLAHANIALLKPWCDNGYDIITTCTSCSEMLKNEYTRVLGIDSAAQISEHVYDFGQYVRQLLETGELTLHLNPVPLVAAYHTPCHLKSQKIGLPLIDILTKIPEFKVHVMDAPCCGQSGSYGFKSEKYDISVKISRTLLESLNRIDPEIALSECGPCRLRMQEISEYPAAHPVSILRRALILPDP